MALTAFVVRMLSAGIALVSQIILARLMGEFEYGIFVFVWVMTIIVGNMSCLGFHSVVVRYLPLYRTEQDYGALFGIANTARILSLGLATTIGALGAFVLYVLPTAVPPHYTTPILIALLTLPMVALGDVLAGTARAHNWALTSFSQTYLIRPTLTLVIMVIAVQAGYSPTAVTGMSAALAATYMTSLFQLVRITRRMADHYPKAKNQYILSDWLKVALPIFLVEGIGYVMTNADVVFVGFYLEPEEVAIYFAAAKTMALMQFVLFSVKSAAAPRYSALVAEGDHESLARFAGDMARWSFWSALAVGAVILLVGDLLLSLFGPNFKAGYPLMAVLFMGYLAKASVGPGEVLLTMAGRQRICAVLYAFTIVANIALNALLTPLYGLNGAAAAIAGTMMVEALLLHLVVRRTLGIVLFAFADPRPYRFPEKAGGP